MSAYKYLMKFIVIGDTGVGKSCLVLKFVEDKIRQEHEVTIGVEFGAKFIKIQSSTIKLQLWDTAGQENFKSITRSYYRQAIGAILVYDITQKQTFENCINWIEDLKQNSASEIVIILVGNKTDLEQKREVSYEQGKKFAEKYNLMFMETSAKSNHNIQEIFMKPANKVYELLEEKIIKINDCAGVKAGSDYYINTQLNSNGNNLELNKSASKKDSGCCK